jgi:hypothetical protein
MVGSIKEDHRGDTHEQAVDMLTNWKRRLGSDAKIKIIVEALREIRFNDIADFIVSWCRVAENATNTVDNSKRKSMIDLPSGTNKGNLASCSNTGPTKNDLAGIYEEQFRIDAAIQYK